MQVFLMIQGCPKISQKMHQTKNISTFVNRDDFLILLAEFKLKTIMFIKNWLKLDHLLQIFGETFLSPELKKNYPPLYFLLAGLEKPAILIPTWRIIPGLGYVVNNHGDRKSPKDLVTFPFQMAVSYLINGGVIRSPLNHPLKAHPPSLLPPAEPGITVVSPLPKFITSWLSDKMCCKCHG